MGQRHKNAIYPFMSEEMKALLPPVWNPSKKKMPRVYHYYRRYRLYNFKLKPASYHKSELGAECITNTAFSIQTRPGPTISGTRLSIKKFHIWTTSSTIRTDWRDRNCLCCPPPGGNWDAFSSLLISIRDDRHMNTVYIQHVEGSVCSLQPAKQSIVSAVFKYKGINA